MQKHEKRYQDKALENRDVLFHLLGRMRQGNMLRACQHQMGTVTFFTVVKKLLEVASSERRDPLEPGFLASSSRVYQILLRLLMDQRWGNCQWMPPPRAQMSSPETIADMDLSMTQLKGGRAHLISGDLPEFYYTLGLEDWQTEYFCVPGVTVTELNQYFEAHGIRPLPQEAGEEHVALQIFCMGWSWAVWGGETTTEDIVIQNSSLFRASMRVRYGAPAPRISDVLRIA